MFTVIFSYAFNRLCSVDRGESLVQMPTDSLQWNDQGKETTFQHIAGSHALVLSGLAILILPCDGGGRYILTLRLY